MSEMTGELDGGQVGFFEENGYLTVPRITTVEELEGLRQIYDEIFTRRIGHDEDLYFDLAGSRDEEGKEVLPQMLAPEHKYPQLRGSVYWSNAMRIAEQLLGRSREELVITSDMILKPARYGRETPWHQDEAYWDPQYDFEGISIWMPLEDASVESGCMQFVAGSHRVRDVAWHRHIDDDPLVHGLMTDDVQPDNAVAYPLPAGGASIHHCRILHYAGPNLTDTPRRAYIFRALYQTRKRDVPAQRPWLDEEYEALARRAEER